MQRNRSRREKYVALAFRRRKLNDSSMLALRVSAVGSVRTVVHWSQFV